MAKLPERVLNAWDERKGPVVLATVSAEGMPNAIYASCARIFDDETLIIADNYFCKTRKNILAGSKGSILFMTNEGKAYQVKGTIVYHRQGPVYEHMKSWNPTKHPGHAAAALKAEEAYSGAERFL